MIKIVWINESRGIVLWWRNIDLLIFMFFNGVLDVICEYV